MQNTLILPESELATIPASRIPINNEWAHATARRRLSVRRILLPFDLSRSSVCALRAVSQFAERTGASIHLLHVVSPAEQQGLERPATECNRADDKFVEASERLLKHWVKRVVQGRVRTHVSIRIGEAVDVIIARAIAMRADLIVMTSRSCSGLKNELQRSSAERVSRLAPCPVLTIPEKCANEVAYTLEGFLTGRWRTVLMPVDFSYASAQALPVAAELAQANGAKLLLAHGSDIDDVMSVQMRLKAWAEQILGDPVSCETAIWPGGHSLFAILAEASRSEVDLIVLPTSSQSWARRLRAGSITDGVLRQSPCPVLSVNENVSLTEN
jgi:nucleotide-binding universal stress UspA family protein